MLLTRLTEIFLLDNEDVIKINVRNIIYFLSGINKSVFLSFILEKIILMYIINIYIYIYIYIYILPLQDIYET